MSKDQKTSETESHAPLADVSVSAVEIVKKLANWNKMYPSNRVHTFSNKKANKMEDELDSIALLASEYIKHSC